MSEDIDTDEPVSEVEFVFQRSNDPFVQLAWDTGCTLELASIVPRSDGRFAEFYNVTDLDADRVAEELERDDTVEVTQLREYDTGGLFECLVSGDCPVRSLARSGAIPREVRGDDGEARIVADIPPQYDSSAIIERFLENHSAATLLRKREAESVGLLYTRSTFRRVLQRRLTDRQREVLRAAFDAGYYEWPRESTGEAVAADLGISSATFSEHIAAAERKLLGATFESRE